MVSLAREGRNFFQELGGLEGVKSLVKSFYDIMEECPEAARIRSLHPEDMQETRENLTLFLCGWLGGPPLYKQKHGSVNLTAMHDQLEITADDRDMWLSCMAQALEREGLSAELKEALGKRFQVPAEKILVSCQERIKGLPIL